MECAVKTKTDVSAHLGGLGLSATRVSIMVFKKTFSKSLCV